MADGQPLDVLMIEDDDDDVLIIGDLLKGAHARIRLARSANLFDGLKRLGEASFDAVLLDLSLPDSRGPDTFYTVRSQFPRLPVVVLSGLDDEDVAYATVQDGAQDYLVKGKLDGELLVRSIRYAIERHAMIRELETKNSELAETSERLRTIIDSNADALIIVSRRGVILFANPAAEWIFESGADELVGSVFGTPMVQGRSAEIAVMRKEGRRLIAEMRVAETVWQRDRAYLASLRDVTRRVEAEQALRLYRDHLQDLVTQRTEALSRANEDLGREIEEHKRTETALREAVHRLEEHNRAQADFVSNVSHELKTPLASIGYAVENLRSGVVGPIPERIEPYVTLIQEDTQRLGTTIADILDMSRLEAQTLRLQRVKVHVGRLALRAVLSIQNQATSKHQRTSFLCRHPCPFAILDPKKFERVVLNIVGNAIKYSHERGLIDVRIEPRPGDPERLRLSVTDDGMGIPADCIERVTERYFRVGEHVSGTGLGLALCKEITELHGGVLTVLSPPPNRAQGTAVIVDLPAGLPPCVVVADPDAAARSQVEQQLRAQGYSVIACGKGEQALALTSSEKADTLVIEADLADMAGVELISRLKANRELQHIPVVMLTGSQPAAAVQDILAGLGVPLLRKPWKADRLITAIENGMLELAVG